LGNTLRLFPAPGLTTGWRAPPRSYRNIILRSCGSIGGSDNP
jgi:hypothetical protein